MSIAVTLILALASLAVGLRAAHLWWQASSEGPWMLPPTTDAGMLLAGVQGELAASAILNSQAAKWTAAAAAVSALTTTWATVAPTIWH